MTTRLSDRLAALVELALHQYLLGPIRRRRYDRRSAPFTLRTRDQLTFRLDPHETVDRHIASDGIYERRFLTFIAKILPPDAVMLDVGANIGNHALFLKDVCREIHCFEPNPRALSRLAANIALNRATNIHVHPFGLGDADRSQPFVDDRSGNLGGSRFVREGQDGASWLPVRHGVAAVAELDLDRIDIIKIDVEGFEPEVFAGLRSTIAAFRPLIAFEHHAKEAGRAAYDAILECLPNYAIFELTYAPVGSSLLQRTVWHFAHAGEPELTPVGGPEPRSYGNLLAIPQEMMQKFARWFPERCALPDFPHR